MWFHSYPKIPVVPKLLETSDMKKRESLADITSEIANLSCSFEGQEQMNDSRRKDSMMDSKRTAVFKNCTKGKYRTIIISDRHDDHRSVVAGTIPFRFMVEATVEVEAAAHN